MDEICLLIPCPCADECARRGIRLCEISEEEYRNLSPLGENRIEVISRRDPELIKLLAELLLS